MKAFNKIPRKHVDFVVTDETGYVKYVIELDDHYHNKKSVQKNDIFKDELFEYLGVKMIRFNVKNDYKFTGI